MAWWSSTQKPIKSPGAIWIVFWVCPVKRPEPRQGSCWQLEVVPWRKKRNLVCSTRTALCHKIGIDLDLNRMHGTLAPKRKEAVPLLCTVAHCTVRAILYTKNVQDEKTKIKKKCEDSISTHILKKKKMWRQTCLVQSLTLRTYCYWHFNRLFSFLKQKAGNFWANSSRFI